MYGKITILGSGVSGTAAAELCRKHKIDFEILDDGEGISLPSDGSTVVVSPGLHPEHSKLYRQAIASDRKIISEMEFGYRFWDRPLLGITGTNGKTTTTELTCHLLNACGMDAECAGNIGRPLSDLAANPESCRIAVVEISSFQLERIEKFTASAAVILNFASDHIDRYPNGFQEYCDVKRRIFNGIPKQNCIYGLSFSAEEHRAVFSNGKIFLDGEEFFDLTQSDLPGAHNAENAAAAIELCLRVLPEKTVKSDLFKDALRNFRRGRHRVETVCCRNGVTFVNDSKGTNPAAVLAAIDSLSGKLVIMLGGLGKGMDFSPLASRADRFRCAILFGADRKDISDVLSDKCRCIDCGNDFTYAVQCAANEAVCGDTVLLSPACASMDMFKNYAARGDRFAELAAAVDMPSDKRN